MHSVKGAKHVPSQVQGDAAKNAHLRRSVTIKTGAGAVPRQSVGNFIAGVKPRRYRATSPPPLGGAILTAPAALSLLTAHGDCDLPMRRQPKHRVQSSALVQPCKDAHVVGQIHFR